MMFSIDSINAIYRKNQHMRLYTSRLVEETAEAPSGIEKLAVGGKSLARLGLLYQLLYAISGLLVWTGQACAQSVVTFSSCGELCVRVICEMYDIETAQEEIRQDLGADAAGVSSFEDLKATFGKYGLQCVPFKGTIHDLRSVAYPMILHVKMNKDDTVGHFFVCV